MVFFESHIKNGEKKPVESADLEAQGRRGLSPIVQRDIHQLFVKGGQRWRDLINSTQANGANLKEREKKNTDIIDFERGQRYCRFPCEIQGHACEIQMHVKYAIDAIDWRVQPIASLADIWLT